MILQSQIIFATLNSAGKQLFEVLKDKINYLIIDEATQSYEIQTLIPLSLNPQNLVLVGDPKQLPGTVFHKFANELNLPRSLYERLTANEKPFMLDTQYRMIPPLCYFPSQLFYNS